jgi:hypothetical protein
MGNINDTNNRLATDTPDTTTTTTTGGVSVTFSSPSNGPCNLTFTPDCGGVTTNNNTSRAATDTPDTPTVTITGINFPYTFYPSEHGVDDIFGTYTFNCGGCEYIRNIERVCNDNDISYTVLGSSVTTTTTEDVTTTSTTEDVTTTSTTEDVTTTSTTEDATTTTTSSGCKNYLLKADDQFTEFRYIACGETNYTTVGLNRDTSRVVCSENIPVVTVGSDNAEVIDTGISCTEDVTTTSTTTEIETTRFYISAGKPILGVYEEGTNEGTGFCDNTYLLSGALWVVGNLTQTSSLLNKTVYTNSDMDTFIPVGYYYVHGSPGYPNGTYGGAVPGQQHLAIRVDANGLVGTVVSHNCGDQGGGQDL